jgi:predicted AAA+ superfamily ATPase
MAMAVEEKMMPTSIEKIVLSGEGRVNFRVDLLYDQVMHGPKDDKKKGRGEKGKHNVPAKEDVAMIPSSSSSSASSTTGTLVDEEYEDDQAVEDEPKEIVEPIEFEGEKIRTNLDKLAKADAIIIAAHSQGVPVTVLLIARLIQEGLIDMEKTRVCIIGMAVCV